MCESRGGRPGLSVPNRPYGLCGRKATLTLNEPLPAACVGLSVSRLPSWVTPGMVSVCFNYWQDSVCITWGWRRPLSAQSVLTARGSDSQFCPLPCPRLDTVHIARGAFSLPASIDYWFHVVVLRNSCRLKSSLTVMLGRVDAPPLQTSQPAPPPPPNTSPSPCSVF